VAQSGNAEDGYAASLAVVLQSAAVPYGVTLTVWASGASVSHFRGAPKIFEIFLFVLGGVAGYTTVGLFVARALQRLTAGSSGPRMVVTGMLHLISIGIALGTVTLIGEIRSWIAWPLGGFGGISLYLTLVAAEYALAPRLSRARRPRGQG
jgi:hypothetical protein